MLYTLISPFQISIKIYPKHETLFAYLKSVFLQLSWFNWNIHNLGMFDLQTTVQQHVTLVMFYIYIMHIYMFVYPYFSEYNYAGVHM